MTARLRIGIVGAGRAGLGLAAALRKTGHRIVAGMTRSAASARRAARHVPGASWSTHFTESLRRADVILICVPDDQVGAVARSVLSGLPARAVLLHLSGSLPSRILPGRRGAAAIGSLHPLYSFPPPGGAPADLAGIWWAVGGAPRARAMARRLARDLGGRAVLVPEPRRGSWHLAAALAANHLVALLDAAAEMAARRVKLPRAQAEAMLVALAASVLASAQRSGLRGALTGPIARGDIATLRRHVALLAREERSLRELYSLLGLRQVRMAGAQRRTSSGKMRRVLKATRRRR